MTVSDLYLDSWAVEEMSQVKSPGDQRKSRVSPGINVH